MYITYASEQYLEEKKLNDILSQLKTEENDRKHLLFGLGIPFDVYQKNYPTKLHNMMHGHTTRNAMKTKMLQSLSDTSSFPFSNLESDRKRYSMSIRARRSTKDREGNIVVDVNDVCLKSRMMFSRFVMARLEADSHDCRMQR